MTWVKVDSGFPNHPKFLAIGDDGLALWVRALAHCNQYLTDGFVSDAILPSLTRSRRPADVALKLISITPGYTVGLWSRVPGGYRFHDYHDYQPTRDQVLDKKSKAKESGKLGGEKSGETRAEIAKKAKRFPSRPFKGQVDQPLNPGPIRSDPVPQKIPPSPPPSGGCSADAGDPGPGSDPEAGKGPMVIDPSLPAAQPRRRANGTSPRQQAKAAAAQAAADRIHAPPPPARPNPRVYAALPGPLMLPGYQGPPDMLKTPPRALQGPAIAITAPSHHPASTQGPQ